MKNSLYMGVAAIALAASPALASKVTVFGPWLGPDQESVEAVLDGFAAATGHEYAYVGSDSFEQQVRIDAEAGSAERDQTLVDTTIENTAATESESAPDNLSTNTLHIGAALALRHCLFRIRVLLVSDAVCSSFWNRAARFAGHTESVAAGADRLDLVAPQLAFDASSASHRPVDSFAKVK